MMARFLVFSILLLLNVQCAFFVKERPELNPKERLVASINNLANDPQLDNAYIGIYIESLKDSSVLFDLNKSDLFIPASNQKLFTSAVALEKLGPDYRSSTEIYTTGSISDSVLNGSLIIRGRGDPAISGRFYDGDVLKIFNDWADSLDHMGIRQIEGDLVGDESLFSDHKLGDGWNWDDEPYYYSAQISALSYNENVIDLEVSARDSTVDTVAVNYNPPVKYITLINNSRIAHPDSSSDLDVWRERGRNEIELYGSLKKGEKDTLSATIEDPALWFITVFGDVLKSHGIELKGDLKVISKQDSSAYADAKPAFTHYSPALRDIAAVVNKKSNNFYAEQLLKILATEVKNEGTAKAGCEVLAEWMEEQHISGKYYYPVDGSGLSRKNLVSPLAVAALLRIMYSSENYMDFYQSLPIAGVDGTLQNRMKNSPAQGVVRAKTGFVRHARNLSGYTTDQAGNDYLFVILVNNYRVPTSYINQLQNKIAILLTSYLPE